MAVLCLALVAIALPPAKIAWALTALAAGLAAAGLATWCWSALAGVVTLALFLGGAGHLWLTEPLFFVRVKSDLSGPADLLAAGLLLTEAGIALTVLLRAGAVSRLGGVMGRLGPGALIAIALLTMLVAATPMDQIPTGHPGAFVKRLVLACALIGLHALTVAALISLPAPKGIRRAPPIWALAVLTLVASATLALLAFDRLPHVEDEVAYLFQAETFARGAVTAPAPPPAAWPGLDYYLMELEENRWFATTTPGWPAGLTLGVWLGAPWLLNPLLAALAVLLTHALVRRIADPVTATVAAAITAVSPWLLGSAGSLMGHSLAHALALACWLLLVLPAAGRGAALGYAFAGGLAMGWVFAIRQLDGLLLGVLTGIALLVHVRRSFGIGRIVAYSLGCLASGIFYFVYNWAVTGNLLQSPLTRYLDESWPRNANAYGFGPDRGPPGGWGLLDGGPGHSPFEAVMSVAQNLNTLHLELLGWGVGSLILLWASLVYRRKGGLDALLWAVVLIDIGAHALYWFSGSFYIGPRYWFAMALPVILLSALGYRALEERLTTAGAALGSVRMALALLLAFSVLVYVPWRGFEKYYGFGKSTAQIRAAEVPHNALVFYSGKVDPGSGVFLNLPFLPADRPVYLRSIDPAQDAAAAAAFPGRPVVHLEVTR